MTAPSSVLVTGSAGRIGQAVVRELIARGKTVRGFDVVPTPAVADHLVGSVSDAGLVRRAVHGVSAIVHLAATPDDDDFHTKLLPNNIVGTYEVLEAARRPTWAGWCWRARGRSSGGSGSPGRCRSATTCSRRRAAGMRRRSVSWRGPAGRWPRRTSGASSRSGWAGARGRRSRPARSPSPTGRAMCTSAPATPAGSSPAPSMRRRTSATRWCTHAANPSGARSTTRNRRDGSPGTKPRDTWPQGVEEMLK